MATFDVIQNACWILAPRSFSLRLLLLLMITAVLLDIYNGLKLLIGSWARSRVYSGWSFYDDWRTHIFIITNNIILVHDSEGAFLAVTWECLWWDAWRLKSEWLDRYLIIIRFLLNGLYLSPRCINFQVQLSLDLLLGVIETSNLF